MSEFETILKGLFKVITERVKYLEEMSARFRDISSFKKADHVYISAIERDLQVAIEACIDVGKVIISEKRLRPPESTRDICTAIRSMSRSLFRRSGRPLYALSSRT